MRWFYSRGKKRFDALWDDGVLLSKDVALLSLVSEMTANGQIVSCGAVGPDLPASLETQVAAWGTITEAVSMLNTGGGKFADCPVVPEAIMDSPDNDEAWLMEKASFGGDRSAAGRYAAEQRWLGHVKGEASNNLDAIKTKVAEVSAMIKDLKKLSPHVTDEVQIGDYNKHKGSLCVFIGGKIVPSKQVMDAEKAIRDLGQQVLTLATQRAKQNNTDGETATSLQAKIDKANVPLLDEISKITKQEAALLKDSMSAPQKEHEKMQIELEKLNARRVALFAEIHASSTLTKAVVSKREAVYEEVLKIMREVRDVNTVRLTIPSEIPEFAIDIEQTMPSAWVDVVNKSGGSVKKTFNKYYQGWFDSETRTIHTDGNSETNQHEFIHAVLFAQPVGRALEQAILARRTWGEENAKIDSPFIDKLKQGQQKEKKEITYPSGATLYMDVISDKFTDPYAGVLYPNGSATETVTVGYNLLRNSGNHSDQTLYQGDKDLEAATVGLLLTL